MRALGLDLGARRIGLAVSDPDGRIAFPAGHLESRGARRDVEAIQQIVRDRGIDQIVVGLPKHMDGREGPEAQAARRFAKQLADATGLPVDTIDERWTSREAERSLARGRRRTVQRKGKGVVDEAAASLLLGTWLDRRQSLAARGELS